MRAKRVKNTFAAAALASMVSWLLLAGLAYAQCGGYYYPPCPTPATTPPAATIGTASSAFLNGDISSPVMGIQTPQFIGLMGFTDHIITHTAPDKQKTELAKPRIEQDPMLRVQADYDFISINQSDGIAYNATYGYAHQFGKLEAGFAVPVSYAYTANYASGASGGYASSYGNLVGLNPYLLYTLQEAPFTLKAGVDVFGSLYTTQNLLYRIGSVNYGGGPLVSLAKSFDLPVGEAVKQYLSTLDLSAGVSYQVSEARVPLSLFTSDSSVQPIVNAIEAKPADQVFTYGFNAGLPVKDVYALNVEVIRSDNISSGASPGVKGLTALGVRGSWYPMRSLEVNLGYRTIQQVANFTSHGITAGVTYRFGGY